MSSPADSGFPISDPNQLPRAPGYTILGVVAHSGMSTIYRARDLSMDRDVAMKVLRPWVKPERLLFETQVTAQLEHPGIVPVYNLGLLSDGRPFLVMALIKGDTLAHLQREPLAANRAAFLAVFERVCETVAHAHTHRVIHRNLRPSKVMLGASGEVYVLGWGLAGVIAEYEPPVRADPKNFIGTAAYMPPEQARGETADARSDVFGLGGLLCAILTGQPSFTDRTVRELLQRSAGGDLTETFARLDTCGADPELIALAKRCLSPKPDDRPAMELVCKVVATYRRAEIPHAATPELQPDDSLTAAEIEDTIAAHRRSGGVHGSSPEQPQTAEPLSQRLRLLLFLLATVLLLLLNAILFWPRF
jgi:eukaryotic-like serine/threonine-protein kinase